jgi:hypothetical protein
MIWREDLEIPSRRSVRWVEDFFGKEGYWRSLVARRHDDDVAFYQHLVARAAFRHTLSTVVEEDAVFFDGVNVAAEPGGLAWADLMEDLWVDHGSFGKEALVYWGDVFEVTIEEETEDGFGNPG